MQTPALIVEDGSNVANANSYVSLCDARAFAFARGITFSDDNAQLTAWLLMAMDYIESNAVKFVGIQNYPPVAPQALSWPRKDNCDSCNITIAGVCYASTTMPKQLIAAQVQLAIQQSNGVVLYPTTTDRYTTEETVGPITTKYSEKIVTDGTPYMPAVNTAMTALLRVGAFGLTTVRI